MHFDKIDVNSQVKRLSKFKFKEPGGYQGDIKLKIDFLAVLVHEIF